MMIIITNDIAHYIKKDEFQLAMGVIRTSYLNPYGIVAIKMDNPDGSEAWINPQGDGFLSCDTHLIPTFLYKMQKDSL